MSTTISLVEQVIPNKDNQHKGRFWRIEVCGVMGWSEFEAGIYLPQDTSPEQIAELEAQLQKITDYLHDRYGCHH